jgi:hypothetical protein
MECQLQMREMAQKLVSTSGPLPIPDPHATGVPSNTLERHLIVTCCRWHL